ncbi:MAG: hypothetical protein WCP34_12305 [Pseudomonadota bacterium]
MKNTKISVTLVILFLGTVAQYPTAIAAKSLAIKSETSETSEALPALGSYGFNWLQPNKAKCMKISNNLLKTFRVCQFKKDGGFDGGYTPSWECSVNANIEYMVFKNRKVCQEQFEVMQANGD